jgi:hypothetical protein
MTDATEAAPDPIFYKKVVIGGDCPADNHVGGVQIEHKMSQTAYRSRGYGFGSQYLAAGEAEPMYMQPGHIQNKVTEGKEYVPAQNRTEAWVPGAASRK